MHPCHETDMHTSPHKAGPTRAAKQASPPARQPTQQPAPLSPELALHRALGNRSYGQYLQAKLTVNRPGDLYEQEADRVAEQVMRMPEPVIQRACDCDGTCASCQEEETSQRQPTAEPITPLMQRQEALEPNEERDAERVQRQVDDEEEEDVLQTKEKPGQMSETPPGTASRVQALRGGGQPLTASERSFFEPRFGLDFSRVQVHTDARAAEAAQAVHAQAFTVGRNVVFGAGQYAPGTTHGQRLMAHELTHVVQQAQGRTPSLIVQRQTDVDVDVDEVDRERFPQYTGVTIGDWGLSHALLGGITELTAQERLPQRFHTADAAIAASLEANTALAVIEEYGAFYVYRLGYDTVYQRFNTTNTLVHFTDSPGSQSSANIVARIPALRALITEDGGILTPTHGVGVLMEHSKNFGEYQTDLQSALGNSLAFVAGLQAGLPELEKAKLATMLAVAGNLSTIFPTPFLVGTVEGLAGELVDTLKLLDFREWPAMLEAARKTAQFLTDPNGREAAEALGAEVGKMMAADVNDAMDKGVVYFSYAMGKLIGPIVVEVVLAFLGIEIGLLSIAGKAARISRASVDLLTDGLRASRLLDDIDLDPSRLVAARGLRLAEPPSLEPVEVRIGNETHKMSIVEKNGRRFVRLCSNGCGELAEKIASVLEHFGGGDETRSRLNELRRKLNELSEGEGPDVQQQFEQIEKKFKELVREDPEVAFAVSEVDLEASRRPQVDLDDEFEQEALERFRPRSSDQESQVIWLVARRLVERVREGEGVPHSIYVAGDRSRLLSADEHYPHLDWKSGFRYYVVVVYREGDEHIQYSANYFPDVNEVGTIKAERGPPR